MNQQWDPSIPCFGRAVDAITPTPVQQPRDAAEQRYLRVEIVLMSAMDDEESVRAFVELGVDQLVPLIGSLDVAVPIERLRRLEKLARLTT